MAKTSRSLLSVFFALLLVVDLGGCSGGAAAAVGSSSQSDVAAPSSDAFVEFVEPPPDSTPPPPDSSLSPASPPPPDDSLYQSSPVQPPEGGWKTSRTDWSGQKDPSFDRNSSLTYRNLECRNWTDHSEYQPLQYGPLRLEDGSFAAIRFTGPERWFFESSIISWDGNFAGGPYPETSFQYLKIGEFFAFSKIEDWKNGSQWDIDAFLASESAPPPNDVTYGDEVKPHQFKITDKYLRYLTDWTEALTGLVSFDAPNIVYYVVDLGGGHCIQLYFYISQELTPEELSIYDRIVESMTLFQ